MEQRSLTKGTKSVVDTDLLTPFYTEKADKEDRGEVMKTGKW